jgi:transporter family protein
MNWFFWALLSALFAGVTAILAKVGVLILSGLATGLSWLCYFQALQLGEASQVAPVDKLSVVIAIALAAIFLHERVTWIHWVGGLLIVSGSIILAYA